MGKNVVLEGKAQRLKWLISVMEQNKRRDFVALVADLEINLGLSRKMAKEYIQTCVNAGYFAGEGNEVIFIKKEA